METIESERLEMIEQDHYRERLSGHSRIQRLRPKCQGKTLPSGGHRGRDIAWVGSLYPRGGKVESL